MNAVKVKVAYIVNRIWLILVIYLASITASTFLFSYFENKSLLDGLWWSCVTALTIGYGDLSPVTLQGRIVGLVFGHFWIFGIIPMIVANIVSNLLENRDLFSHGEQEELKANIAEILNKLKQGDNH